MRAIAKKTANGLSIVLATPLWLAYLVSAAIVGKPSAFQGVSQLVSLMPGLSGQYVRRGVYRLVLAECGEDVCVSFGTLLSHNSARLGPRCYVGSYCMLGDVDIQQDVLVGSNVSIINGNRQHGIDRLDVPVRDQPGEFPRVTIGEDTWIGDRALVMASVGKHAVVGAAAVVTKAVPDYAIVLGNPARIVGYRGEHSETANASERIHMASSTQSEGPK